MNTIVSKSRTSIIPAPFQTPSCTPVCDLPSLTAEDALGCRLQSWLCSVFKSEGLTVPWDERSGGGTWRWSGGCMLKPRGLSLVGSPECLPPREAPGDTSLIRHTCGDLGARRARQEPWLLPNVRLREAVRDSARSCAAWVLRAVSLFKAFTFFVASGKTAVRRGWTLV